MTAIYTAQPLIWARLMLFNTLSRVSRHGVTRIGGITTDWDGPTLEMNSWDTRTHTNAHSQSQRSLNLASGDEISLHYSLCGTNRRSTKTHYSYYSLVTKYDAFYSGLADWIVFKAVSHTQPGRLVNARQHIGHLSNEYIAFIITATEQQRTIALIV